MSFLKIDKIKKSFGKTAVLKEISLDLPRGSFLVLVGPSGCGKSTLLNILAGLEKETSGSLLKEGQPINHLSPAKRNIAMVFQSYALYPNMTVRKNISFGLEIRKHDKGYIDKKISEVSKILKIEHLLDRKPAELSGGQRQRVAMGRAIVRDPDLFLFDEPLSNLDAKLRVEMRLEIRKLHQRLGTTVVYVTHDQVEAMTLADQIAVMNSGEIQQLGSPYEIYYNPRNVFVSGFMGSPAMNYFQCEVVKKENQYSLQVKDNEETLFFQLQRLPENIDRFLNKPLILGLRPESILLATESKAAFKKKIEAVEMTGSESFLLLNIDNKEILAKVETGVDAKLDQEKLFTFDCSKAVFFDPETQINLDFL